jgi:hypothetical protein
MTDCYFAPISIRQSSSLPKRGRGKMVQVQRTHVSLMFELHRTLLKFNVKMSSFLADSGQKSFLYDTHTHPRATDIRPTEKISMIVHDRSHCWY